MTAKKLATAAIAKMDSESMRSWASNTHNFPIIVKMARGAIKTNGGKADVTAFSSYLTLTALG